MSESNAQELARIWLQSAQDSLRTADIAQREGLFANAVFNARQAAEKALKAYLLFHTREFPYTHDLAYERGLGEKCDAEFTVPATACGRLTEVYTEPRYPETIISLNAYTGLIAAEATQLARQVLEFIAPRMT